MTSADTLVYRSAALPPLSRLVLAAAITVVTWEARMRTRKGLRHLDAHLLRDIGLDESAAQHQAALPFWRA